MENEPNIKSAILADKQESMKMPIIELQNSLSELSLDSCSNRNKLQQGKINVNQPNQSFSHQYFHENIKSNHYNNNKKNFFTIYSPKASKKQQYYFTNSKVKNVINQQTYQHQQKLINLTNQIQKLRQQIQKNHQETYYRSKLFQEVNKNNLLKDIIIQDYRKKLKQLELNIKHINKEKQNLTNELATLKQQLYQIKQNAINQITNMKNIIYEYETNIFEKEKIIKKMSTFNDELCLKIIRYQKEENKANQSIILLKQQMLKNEIASMEKSKIINLQKDQKPRDTKYYKQTGISYNFIPDDNLQDIKIIDSEVEYLSNSESNIYMFSSLVQSKPLQGNYYLQLAKSFQKQKKFQLEQITLKDILISKQKLFNDSQKNKEQNQQQINIYLEKIRDRTIESTRAKIKQFSSNFE